MKTALAVVTLLLALLCGALAWANHTFKIAGEAGANRWVIERINTPSLSVVPTQAGDEYLLLGPVQAAECAMGGGCAVFSQREFRMAVTQIIAQFQRQGKSL